jgi:ferric-dicitrate binding protein FerR (iron transport regulator)
VAGRAHIESLLQAYLDGELSPAEKVLFERERAESPEFAKKVAQAQRVAGLLIETLGSQGRTQDLTAGVMAHLPEIDATGDYKRQEIARETTWRTKHPRSRTSLFLTVMSAMAPVVLAFLGFAIFQAWPGAEHPLPVVGMITSVDGTARVHDAAGFASHDASLLTAIHPGDAIETHAESGLALALAGPTLIKTPASSRVKVIGPRTIQLEKGRAWLNVAKNAERFRVRTAMGDITVFGTTFDVEVQPGHVVVTLQEGEVTVENGSDFTVLYPGQQARMNGGEVAIEKVEVDADSILAWAGGIHPDPTAYAQFLASVRQLDENVLRAEQVWWVDTRSKSSVSAMAFSWETSAPLIGPMSYDVLVYNENMQPLFSRRLEGALLANATARQVELQLPDGAELGATTTFVRLVPDESSGKSEVLFKEVSLIGASAPAVQ